MEKLREELAAYAHEAWAGWMKYLFDESEDGAHGTVVIPKKSADRWKIQMATGYADLPESMKPSDRAEADKMLGIVNRRADNWISVEDRLPEPGEYIVSVGGEIYVARLHVDNLWEAYPANFAFKPTHWKRFPEPPKGR